MTNDTYDIVKAIESIENELIASMIANLEHHQAEEIKEGYNWSQWQVEQLAALDRYKKQNLKKYSGVFDNINKKIKPLIDIQRAEGNSKQEVAILNAIKDGAKIEKTQKSVKMAGKFIKINDRKVNALINATINDVKKGEVAILRMTNDKYRKIIYNAQVYASTGASYKKAVDMATKDFLAAGINCIEYQNGSRHTLEEYTDMAIRTAQKRAYLTGEGEKRKEWGISTVIMNKRGDNPCPKCLPFVGKIMIDDVWSGGSSEDGPYPLMSSAVAAGLYHPRCKDHHTTYFEGISEKPDDTFTKAEIKEIENNQRKTNEQQYAERQAKKYNRLSTYSLDEDNKKMYKAREKEWKEKAGLYTAETGKKNNEFIPAKTIEEAQEYIAKFVDESQFGALGVSYKGLSVDTTNEVNRVLTDLFFDYDVKKFGGVYVPKANSKIGKQIDGAVAGYSPVRNSLILNKNSLDNAVMKASHDEEVALIAQYKNDPSSLSFKTKRAEEVTKASILSGRATVPETIEEALNHEFGHALEKVVKQSENYGKVASNMQKYAEKISGYATYNENEYIAESFASYRKGENVIDSDLRKIFDSLKSKNGVATTSKSDTINTEELINYNSSSFKTYKLSKKEYAHVMSELNTNVNDRQKELKVFTKAIGEYVYTVENNGFGNYRIIGRTKID